jgi:hypothetical protein
MHSATELDFIQDRVSGINVRLDNFRVLGSEVPFQPSEDAELEVPYCVSLWHDGLDYDEEGNAYQDEYPEFIPHTYHRTLKDAETEAAWLIERGVASDRVDIGKDGYWIDEWEQKYLLKD